MNEHEPECPQCKLRMERGFLTDQGYGAIYPAAWVAGVAKWNWLRGLKVEDGAKMPVSTFRCPQCGRLESFAQPGKWP